MPYYCTVPRCTSMAGKAKNVSFHQFPRDEELAKLWNKILKRGKPYTKYSKVCSLHFTPEDYTITSVGKNKGQWRTLRKDAIPSQNLPSESPTPCQRKQWGSWTHNTPSNVLDPTIQQQMAQAIYMQTMLAMQTAGAAEIPTLNNGISLPLPSEPPFAHTSNTSDTVILKGKQAKTHETNTSYKCTDCSKCFKDPDVFLLHKRSHIKHEKNEKENFNLNVTTLQSNPILANLLKTNNENSIIIDNNVVENLLMTAVAAKMEGYMRHLTTWMKTGKSDSNLANSDIRRDSNQEELSNDSDKYDRDVDNQDVSQSDSCQSLHRQKMNEFVRNQAIENDSIQLYKNDSDVRNRGVRYYESDRDFENDDVTSFSGGTNVANDSRVEPICDIDMNESIDSNKLVIDETV